MYVLSSFISSNPQLDANLIQKSPFRIPYQISIFPVWNMFFQSVGNFIIPTHSYFSEASPTDERCQVGRAERWAA